MRLGFVMMVLSYYLRSRLKRLMMWALMCSLGEGEVERGEAEVEPL